MGPEPEKMEIGPDLSEKQCPVERLVSETNKLARGDRRCPKCGAMIYDPFGGGRKVHDVDTGTHQIGFHDQRGKAANKPTLGKREANATPLEFRDELLRLALHSAT